MGGAELALTMRLEQAAWHEPMERTGSRLALMREHLRRSALWSRHLGSESWRFFDVAGAVDPTVWADDSLVERVLAVARGYPVVGKTCVYALRFAVLRDRGVELPELPDPFEPLVLLYERGGGWARDCSGIFIEIDMCGLPIRNVEHWLAAEALPSLSSGSLAELDERFTERRN
jgi:hypothetical protein